jgi:hypothetical protein
VLVDAARLARWAAGFADRHGEVECTVGPEGVGLRAVDGAVADLAAPYRPWDVPEAGGPGPVEALAAHVLAPRRIAVLLVRRGGYGCALLDGGRVTASKVGSRHVQGRTAAGGWSQQRFARRREKQTDELAGAAADVAARLLLEPPARWLVTGGDRPLVEQVLADPRLHSLAGLPRGQHLAIGDPSGQLVRSLPELLTRVRITLVDP